MRRPIHIWGGVAAIVASFVIFIVPFLYIAINALKSPREAATRSFDLPAVPLFWDNLVEVVRTRDYMLVTAFINSTILTVASVTLLVIFAAMIAYVLQRRPSIWTGTASFLILAGLIIPPAVVPTIWLLQSIGLFKTLVGLTLIEIAYGLPFAVLLFRAFIATIPRELDEAAIIDGAGPLWIFFGVILPMLKPAVVTVIVSSSVAVFNDFTNPLYYLPGPKNVTVQLTLFNFMSQFSSSFNLLFMNILIITIPPLIVYIFFNRQIVAGLSGGAVKG